jgi:hypothetical protein
MKSLVGIIMLVASSFSNAENIVAVEWAPFIKASGVTDIQLIKAADQVNHEFLAKQPGFIKRELIKKSDTEYADIIHWESKKEAVEAGNKVMNCVECNQYFTLMDMESSASAGSGFSHYEVLKKW